MFNFKNVLLTFSILLLTGLTACNSSTTYGTQENFHDNLVEDSQSTSPLVYGESTYNDEASPTNSEAAEPTPEPAHEWTIEEFGSTIMAASAFWDDWWSLRGIFAGDEHINDTRWYYWVEQPDHPLSRGYSILLPSSGFSNLNDIGVHLQQFYTESWIDRELFGVGTLIEETGGIIFGSPWAFEEYDGVLYIATARYGALRPDWTTASHSLIEQVGNTAVVETIVTGYDHRGSGDEMPTATFHFTFINGRIESGQGVWTWPDTGAWGGSSESEQTVWVGFYTSVGDTFLFIYRAEDVVLGSFDQLHTFDHTLIWETPRDGEQFVIGVTQPIHNVSLVHMITFWDEATDEFGYILAGTFPIASTVNPGEGLHILNYSSLGTAIPGSGISFSDSQGQQHFFAINHDNSDSPHQYMMWNITDEMRFE